MKTLACLLLVLSFVLSPTAAAAEIKVPGTSVVFDAPAGFTPLSGDEIAVKYPRGGAPEHVIGNARRTTTIAYGLKPDSIRPEQLAEAMKAFEQVFERVIAGIVWKQRKLTDIAGQRWIYLEMTSNAIDTDIHNIMLITSYEQKMLMFNFNSTKEEFPQVESALRKSLGSITLKKTR